MNEEIKDLEGVKLYKPVVIAVYTVLSGMAVGLFLYGLNVVRRGQRWVGGVILVLSGALFILIAATVTMGGRVSGLGMVGVLVAVFVYQLERRPYTLALARGATPAKWWPPVFMVLGLFLVVAVMSAIFAPATVLHAP